MFGEAKAQFITEWPAYTLQEIPSAQLQQQQLHHFHFPIARYQYGYETYSDDNFIHGNAVRDRAAHYFAFVASSADNTTPHIAPAPQSKVYTPAQATISFDDSALEHTNFMGPATASSRRIWTDDLQALFQESLAKLIQKERSITPKYIVKLMNRELAKRRVNLKLTRMQVASHLQQYRHQYKCAFAVSERKEEMLPFLEKLIPNMGGKSAPKQHTTPTPKISPPACPM